MAALDLPRVFDTRRVAQSLRVSVWQNLSSRFLVPLDIASIAPTIDGQMKGHQCGEFKACQLIATPHVGHRTPTQASGVGADRYKVAIATYGRVTVRQLDRATTLSPGEMTIYDTSMEYTVGSNMPFGVFIALLPQDALGIDHKRAVSQAVLKISNEQADPVRNQLLNLNQRSTTNDWQKAAELLGRLVQSTRGKAHMPSLPEMETAERVQELVTRHLRDSRLSPNFIAALLGISRRQLYAVSTPHLGPLATYIRRQRLEHSRLLLDNDSHPPHVHSITDIALASGFDDPAHFSRLFRSHFGLSPSSYRRQLTPTY